jgi:hypothetical protein
MTMLTRSTLRMITVRAGITRKEIPEEAVKLLELYNDPSVSPEQKVVAKSQLDAMIKELESRVTTRRLHEATKEKK